MAKAANQVSRKVNKTNSGKSPGKSAILAELDAMSFEAGSLLVAAQDLATDLKAGRKLTRHHVKISKPEALTVEDVVAIRKNLDMSQAVFASVLGVTPASVMNWEYGRRAPSGPVRRLLQIAARQPEILLEFA
jgi:putative transcriptional regulator